MKNFFVQISFFLLLVSIGGLSVFFLADGNSDSHYLHFTTPRQSSLILGTSKAAQGVQPHILNDILNRKDIYNYAFTIAHSPYGPVYFNSIKKKLDLKTRDGIFILTIDPYSVSSRLISPDDIKSFRENDRAVAQVRDVNTYPNIDYLLNHFSYPYIYILTKKMDIVDDDLLHDDGWVEININMKPNAVRERKEAKLIEYSEKLEQYTFSELRYKYFEKTVDFLKQHGKVFIVRLPVSKPFLDLENKVYGNFDEKIENTCRKYDVKYLDLTLLRNELEYTDGNHLYKSSGKEISTLIGKWIQSENSFRK